MSAVSRYLHRLITTKGLMIPAGEAELYVQAKAWLLQQDQEKEHAAKIEEIRLLGDADIKSPPPPAGSESPESLLHRASVGTEPRP